MLFCACVHLSIVKADRNVKADRTVKADRNELGLPQTNRKHDLFKIIGIKGFILSSSNLSPILKIDFPQSLS